MKPTIIDEKTNWRIIAKDFSKKDLINLNSKIKKEKFSKIKHKFKIKEKLFKKETIQKAFSKKELEMSYAYNKRTKTLGATIFPKNISKKDVKNLFS